MKFLGDAGIILWIFFGAFGVDYVGSCVLEYIKEKTESLIHDRIYEEIAKDSYVRSVIEHIVQDHIKYSQDYYKNIFNNKDE